jgi:hypothetical protein
VSSSFASKSFFGVLWMQQAVNVSVILISLKFEQEITVTLILKLEFNGHYLKFSIFESIKNNGFYD